LGARVDARNAMPTGVVLGFRAIAPHHRHELRALCFLKTRTAFDLGHVAAADDAPPHRIHAGDDTRSPDQGIAHARSWRRRRTGRDPCYDGRDRTNPHWMPSR